ncbi:MAG: hypothetical protein HND53_08115 [Proteobacteria bacterium]|nr:hypothetical protein [Pseudomonadota bacterium]NOG60447.1 hypothetical protein [Pseudomonadota bacterium]
MEKKSDLDWSILKGPLVVFCICLVFSSVLVGGSYYFNSDLEKEYNNNKNLFQSISRRYLDVDQEEMVLRDFYPKFVNLYNRGIIGQEKRLNWIEALRQAGEKVELPSLTYSINSQEEHIPEYNINYSGYTLYRSSMELTLGLLHEGDLFKLIEYINNTAEGIYTLTECSFNQNGKEIQYVKDNANITASCLLYWITIDLAGGQRIEIS